MKKINVLLVLMLVVAMVAINGCKKDDEEKPAPTIAFSGGDSKEVDLNTQTSEQVVFNATITAEGKIESFTIVKTVTGTQTTTTTTAIDAAKGETSYVHNFDYTFTDADFANGVTKIEYTFNVTDKQAISVSKTFTVTKKSAVPINTYSNIVLKSAFIATTEAQYVNALTGVTYNHAATNAITATFGFVSGGTANGATIFGSENDLTLSQQPAGWTTAAKFATTTVSAAEFDDIANNNDLVAKVPSSITADKVNFLQDGATNENVTVIAFIHDGKKGLIKLPANITNNGDQSITIAIKVQQ